MSLSAVDTQKIKRITKELRHVYDELRSKYKWLLFQDAIGLSIMLLSAAMICYVSWLWILGNIETWFLLLWVAFWTSILHELEHDLIHGLYFKKNKFIVNLMFFVVWIFRPITINPWIRKYWHYHHHQHSGKIIDIEERGVTNGEKWSIKRFLMTPDLILSFLLRSVRIIKEIKREIKENNLDKRDVKMLRKTLLYGFMPFGIIAYILFYFWLYINVSILFNFIPFHNFMMSFWWMYLNPIVMIFILPNYIRQFCLHFITSNMHYYGDIADGDIIRQTQVLNAWWTFPFQLFCFNFGATHSIHHFVVNEPFYTRQMSMKRAHKIFKNEGIRFNDIKSLFRANRFGNNP